MNDDSGFVALWVVAATLLVFSGALVVVAIAADVNATAARARTAADAAALAGMAESPLTGGRGDPIRPAERLAAVNGATLIDDNRRGWPFRFTVTVRATPSVAVVERLLPEGIVATSAAAVRPSLLAAVPASPATGLPRQAPHRPRHQSAHSPGHTRSPAGSLGQKGAIPSVPGFGGPAHGYAGPDPPDHAAREGSGDAPPHRATGPQP